MNPDPNEVVSVFRGTMVEAETFQQVLADAGIESKVVGEALTASFGSALRGSVELWVHQRDAEKAAAAIRRDEERRGRREGHEPFPHPTSDPKPGAAPHRKEPHVKQDPLGE
jgi:hypothetical protein